MVFCTVDANLTAVRAALRWELPTGHARPQTVGTGTRTDAALPLSCVGSSAACCLSPHIALYRYLPAGMRLRLVTRDAMHAQGLLATEVLLLLPKLCYVHFSGNPQMMVGEHGKETVQAFCTENIRRGTRAVGKSCQRWMDVYAVHPDRCPVSNPDAVFPRFQ